MNKIKLENIKIYAFHGCLQEEKILGTYYLLNLELQLDLTQASQTDDLEDTLNYALAYEIIHQEMAIPSNLLEHVAGRINQKLASKFSQLTQISTQITKLSPPMSGEIEGVSVEITKIIH